MSGSAFAEPLLTIKSKKRGAAYAAPYLIYTTSAPD